MKKHKSVSWTKKYLNSLEMCYKLKLQKNHPITQKVKNW